MFPQTLYDDGQRMVQLDWFGYGALRVRSTQGVIREASCLQRQFLLDALWNLRSLCAPVDPSAGARRTLFRIVIDLMDHPEHSTQWQGALYEGPLELAYLVREKGEARASTDHPVAAPNLFKTYGAS